MSWNALYEMAARHRGAFAVRWAPQVDLTPAAVRSKARREAWRNPYRDVVMTPGAIWNHLADLTAVQLSVRADAAAAGASAAWLHGVARKPPARPHLLAPHHQRVEVSDLQLRRSRHLQDTDVTIVKGIVTLTPTFWIISIAGKATADALLSWTIDLRQRAKVNVIDVVERLDSMPAVAGRARLLRVLERLTEDGSDSVFESRVRERLRTAGLAPSAAPVPVDMPNGVIVHFDIAFPVERIAIECMGFMAHSSRGQLNRDAQRDNTIALSDEWLVLKLTWDRFMHDWNGFLPELLTALARRR